MGGTANGSHGFQRGRRRLGRQGGQGPTGFWQCFGEYASANWWRRAQISDHLPTWVDVVLAIRHRCRWHAAASSKRRGSARTA